ncbi:MAG TPA: YHS domain-containing protein [Phycisphaerae bacterium]|jgi:YHS domain-containing protein|nr:YHS domain-containing protein [Phycisphaerae bacterium]HOB73383.1 YHS domain-containing protein [Phycisphaerae bacterium]HOJ54965.1 YHS domain-containing protein [Phycisphaerae bacterium]HOL25025.1 YHS domain-containing protein [Phycisphaerae bacterium]HPP21326.1 YHS domain-containing protein [Phycisphaerae bacterium]
MKTTTGLVCALGLLLSLITTGCERKESPTTAPATQAAAVDTGGQTLCPVGGDKIDPAVFIEYKGKKVYFCCEGCDKIFEKNPEKYVKKLPQFGGKEEPGEGGMGM